MRQGDFPLPGESEQVLRGTVERVTFRNPENGYSVLQVSVQGVPGTSTVVGSITQAAPGIEIVARGRFTTHTKFGKQFSATVITETVPSTTEGLQRYLASGVVRGIGEKTAEKIVESLGTDAISVIRSDPERVSKIAGVGKHKADLLCAMFTHQDNVSEVHRFLLEHGVTNHIARKIFEAYGPRAIEQLSKDPYCIARDIHGVGFLTADSIAASMGVRRDSPQRLRAGLVFTLERSLDDGHCFLPHDYFTQKARTLLQLEEDVDLDGFVAELTREGTIIARGAQYLLPQIHRAEEFVAEFIASRTAPRPEPMLPESDVIRALEVAAAELQVEFSAEQRQTVLDATRYRLLVITGGPGCGKTTIIRALSVLYREAGKRLLLAAPTGRAAQRMSLVCTMPASTIHRLLRYDPIGRRFIHGPNDPLVADAVVIDEASMLDVQLAMNLFSAIPRNATLILVGDKDQLPSVGPGRVFGDIVGVPEIRTVALSRLFRRSEASSITSIAHLINAGTVPTVPSPDGTTKTDAYFLPKSDPEEAAPLIESLVVEQLPKKFQFAPHEIMVITPTHRGPLGTVALNTRIQARMSPSGPIDPEQEVLVGENIFRVGDRVVQQVNNYNLGEFGVFNGDVGTVVSASKSAGSLTVELWDGRLITYEGRDLFQLSLAYAMTVHRSQGSEIPCVVLALHDSHYTLLERQLIYTAVTRAKKLLVMVGSKRAFGIAVKRTSSLKRFTDLKARIGANLKT